MKIIKINPKIAIPSMLLISMIIAIFLVGCASAATITVDQGGTYRTITQGINAAAAGDDVVVNPGTYNENVNINKNNINLASSGTGTVTIKASNTATSVITVSNTNAIINGFTITGSNSYGINVNTNMNCNIINNIIHTNNNSGINIAGGTSRVNIDNNMIYNNGGALGSGNPNILINAGTNTISNNKIYNTGGAGDDGIRIPGGTNTIFNNEIYGCEDGIDVEGGSNTIVANILRNNREDGINVDSLGNGLTISFNAIYGNSQYGIHKTVTGTLGAKNNWWGHDTAPTSGSSYGSDIYPQRGTIDPNPWLILTVTANQDTINVDSYSIITADFSYNSQGVIPTSPTGYRFPLISISFTTTDNPVIGTLNPASSYTNSLTDPRSTSTFTGNTGGLAHISAGVGGFSKQVTVKIISTTLEVTNKIYSQLKSTIPIYSSEDYYYIIVKNTGTDTAKNVVITNTMLPALSFNIIEWWVSWDDQVNYMRKHSSFNPATGIWNIGDILGGKTMYLDIRTIVRYTGSITNTATATANNANNANGAFNINVPISPGSVDLNITNRVSNPTLPSGTEQYMAITITKPGGVSAATGIIVNDGLPAESVITNWRTFDYVTTNKDPAYDYWTGVWNVGSLNSSTGNTKTLEIWFYVPAGTTQIISTVYGNQNDPALNNNIATVAFTVTASLQASQSTPAQIVPAAAFAATSYNTNADDNFEIASSLDNGTDLDNSNNETNSDASNDGLVKIISDLLIKILELVNNAINSVLCVLIGMLNMN